MQARQLHNSGNDAVHTLKALVLLFCSYQEDAMEQSKLSVRPSHFEQDELVEVLCWERLDLLRQIARCCPRTLSVSEARRAARKPLGRPPRVENPDLFEADATSDEESEGGMISIFGDNV